MLIAYGLDLSAGTELEVDSTLMGGRGAKRRTRPDVLLIDWSGNEMSAKEFALAKGSAHLYIDHEGVVWQLADLATRMFESSKKELRKITRRAILVVIQNKGLPPADSRVPRGLFSMEVGPIKADVLAANSDQTDSLVEVVNLVCESFGFPPCVPRVDEEPVARKLSPKTIDEWSGVLLSLHLAKTPNPGPGILEAMAELEDEVFGDLEVDEDDFDEEADDILDEEDVDGLLPEVSE